MELLLRLLLKLLDNEDRTVRRHAIKSLGRLKVTVAIDRLVSLWPDEYTVAEALKAMGPAAEPAVLRQLGGGSDQMRSQACQVLQEIGTKKSIPALEKIEKESSGFPKIFAQHALDAIRKRQ